MRTIGPLLILLVTAAVGLGMPPSPTRALFARMPVTAAEASRLLERAREGGFNTLIVETLANAQAVYPSSVFPQRPEFRDSPVAMRFLADCAERDLRVWAWVQVLNWGPKPPPAAKFKPGPRALLDEHPEWLDRTADGITSGELEKGNQFVSPSSSEVRQRLRDFCLELGEHFEVDGVVFDAARGPRDPKRRAHFGYSGAARERFLRDTGLEPLLLASPARDTDETELARWIRWTAWRENEVSTLVSEMATAFREGTRRRGVRGMVAALVEPDYYRERGRSSLVQDWARWAREGYVEAVLPRLDAFAVRDQQRNLDEARARLREAKEAKLLPVFAWRKGSRHPEIRRQLDFVEQNRLDHVAWLSYETLAEAPGSFKEIRQAAAK